MNHYHIVRSYLPTATIGYMDIGGKRLQTIEKPWKDNQPYESCVFEGTHVVHSDDTGKHQWYAVEGTANRDAIEWHIANSVNEVVGCTGFGMSRASDGVSLLSSRKALEFIQSVEGDNSFLVTYRGFNPLIDKF